MARKPCPACYQDVPVGAYRCKSCFHDFDAVEEKKAGALMTLLTLISAMAVLASGTFYISSQKPSEIVTRLSEENQAVISMKMTASGLELDKASFSEIAKIEHKNDGSNYSVNVHTFDGRSITFQEGDYPLNSAAEDIANIIRKTNENVQLVGVESTED